MQSAHVPLEATDWSLVEEERQPGESGHATSKTRMIGSARLRLVEYTPGFVANHWCMKGHVIYCVAGEVTVEVKDGSDVSIRKGMSLVTEADGSPHRLSSVIGALLFIVD